MCTNMYRNPDYELNRHLHELELDGEGKPFEREDTPQREPDEAEKRFKSKYGDILTPLDKLSPLEFQQRFDNFVKDVFIELSLKFGTIDDLVVTENFNHLNGNLYIKFRSERAADLAVEALNNRWYDERPIYAELSPLQNFDEAICGSYEETGKCSRSVNCNFWHLKKPSPGLRKQLFSSQRKTAQLANRH